MIMNYNNWFFNQHKYLKNSRDTKWGYNDTKWVTINKRYQKLVDMKSDLLIEQPFLVHGNNVGFDKLLDLISRSNYTFDDLDKSMEDTYRMTLQNAMSRNLVNTHAVMFHCNNMTKENVSSEKFTHYRIIDAPFNQLHFGHRDDFIRQKLREMHTTENDYYISIQKFNSSPFVKILDFSIMCTVNGYFCNDCMIAVDDKGFKFKVGWPWSSDVDFIVYKLEHGKMYSKEVDVKDIYQRLIKYDALGVDVNHVNGMKCIINIYDKNFIKTVPSVPNFGIFTDEGLLIRNLQRKTINTFEKQLSSKVIIDIYALKFFHEIPNLYPAVNYYDILDSRGVYDERYENIKTKDGYRVLATPTTNINYLEKCTPPIAIDKNVNYSFNVILNCIALHDKLMEYNDLLLEIGGVILDENLIRFNEIRYKIELMYADMLRMFTQYQQGAILTSLVSSERIELFENLIKNINKLMSMTDWSKVQEYVFDELYSSNYSNLVSNITYPFHGNALSAFSNMNTLTSNYFDEEVSTRFNRPISEQCFISLRYHNDDECWLFDYPEIKHFHGIGNTFYIDSGLNGDELFKFFILYSDTEAPVDKNIEHFNLDTVLDFDLFSKEVDRYIGCIRYWDAECRLLKISKMLYNNYDDETCVQIFSKILKRKIHCDSLLKIYPSDMNYEESNANSDMWDDYDENTERGPFAINFLFYTLSMLNNNEDKLQAYFYRHLTNQKYNNRYSDIDISDMLDNERYPLSYSQFAIAPSRLSNNVIKPENGKAYMYYCLPLIIRNDINLYEPYRYVLNVYDKDVKYPIITENDINHEMYVQYDDIAEYAGITVSYHDNVKFAKMVTLYLTSLYDYISDLQTNYTTSFNQTSLIASAIETLSKHINKISDFVNTKNIDIHNVDGISSDVDTVINILTLNNHALTILRNIKNKINEILIMEYNGGSTTIIPFINSQLLGTLKHVYVTTGFDNCIMKRARMLYLHLKHINEPMNCYQFKKWLNDIDMYTLKNLDKMLADNENYVLGDSVFVRLHDALRIYINKSLPLMDELNNMINDLTDSLQLDHVDILTSFCNDVINKEIFDIYTISMIRYNKSIEYNDRPHLVVITLPESTHTKPPIGISIPGTHTIALQPIIDKINNKYVIRSLSNICEYVFFDGESLIGLTMNILNDSGNVIGTQQVVMTFNHTCCTSDVVNQFNQLPNMKTTAIEFENGHESFDIVNGLIVNEKHADMNYEMLIGNHFVQLTHDIEYVLEPKTWLQGSIDRLYINNQMINRMCIAEFGHHNCHHMFFKPSQVFHININNDGSIDSLNGKYFEGQTVYLKTCDGLTSFPVIISKVDHSINKGFIEAYVDQWNAKWFEIKDKTTITIYLKSNIECEVVDDNIRNFLDEFTNDEYNAYSNIEYNEKDKVFDKDIDTCYTLPGDPIYVSSNSDIVYNRLNWFFNDVIPNRFIDEEHKTHRFIYITNGFIMNSNDELKINMINHEFNDLTLPERYPVLRDEPNDHSIWDKEIETFSNYKRESKIKEMSYYQPRIEAEEALDNAKTKHDKEVCIFNLERIDRQIKKEQDFQDKLELMMRQLETPNTWFNVRSYGASLVYIANGRADRFSPTFINNIRDIAYSDKVDVWLYDWEHHQWLDPSTYESSYELIDNIKIDESDDYKTNRVLYTFTIKPKDGFVYSKKILVYFSYNKSDVFNDIEMNPSKCMVRFKPLLSLDNDINDYNPYSDIRIRKHFDGYEKYKVTGDNIHIKRVKRSGTYTYSPEFRVCDIIVNDSNGEHTFNDIQEFLVPSPFKLTTQRLFHKPSYRTIIHSQIDSFEPDKNIKLICISNNDNSSYDGNISSIMFEGLTSYDEDTQCIEITNSTLPNYVSGSFICTVFQDSKYDSVGGVITVIVTTNTQSIYDEKWTKVPLDYMKYREVPMEFKLVMKQPTTIDDQVTVTLKNHYVKSINDTMTLDNHGINNPFEYYYDSDNLYRLPISNTRLSNNKQRLVVDTTSNENVNLIKSSYMGICRYSIDRIPSNGLIDLTGYIPTPLSRDRYEFWINGRCISDNKNLIILSPTSIQLCNMQSLRNFEVIELVDDFDSDNELMKDGNMYIDMNGNSYSTYKLALLSNKRIHNQDIRFVFNTNTHHQIHDHVKDIISDPNNHDTEEDILSYITFDEGINDYNKLYNIPSINGVSLFHPKLQDLGISEIPNEKILDMFDNVWKIETLTNPLFMTTHRNNSRINDETALKLHIKQLTDNHWSNLDVDTNGMFLIHATGSIDKYFSLYISKKQDGVIDDTRNTVKIIPFIMAGVYVLIDKKYKGMWLHSTYGKTTPIHII